MHEQSCLRAWVRTTKCTNDPGWELGCQNCSSLDSQLLPELLGRDSIASHHSLSRLGQATVVIVGVGLIVDRCKQEARSTGSAEVIASIQVQGIDK